MQKYKDLSGTSGIEQYDSAIEHIDIEWKDGKVYRYDYSKPGAVDVERMKELAVAGEDLATYVNQHVRKNFAEQLR